MQRSRPVSRILCPHYTGRSHSSRPFVAKRLERPTRKRRLCLEHLHRAGSSKNVSLFGLAPRGVCLAVFVAKHAGKLLPHRFTHHRSVFTRSEYSDYTPETCPAGLFSVALVVTCPSAGARTLSGSLPYGVRTFLFSHGKATARPASLQG